MLTYKYIAARDTAASGSSEDKTPEVEDSVKENDVTVITTTTKEPVAPAVIQISRRQSSWANEEKPGGKEVDKEATRIVENTE